MIYTSSFSNSTDPDDQPDLLLDERVLLLEEEENDDEEEDVDKDDELCGIIDVLFAYLGDCNDDEDDEEEFDYNYYDNESIYAILAFALFDY
ncbi:MAG: hypothetical protein EZS28_054078 [Streblomastix strix]|uniref:Uncharacterized protein n=1 Tax=Streblomastix strix TaxID=222440 RepID=A0A5J4QXC3_9EUKA|nr:MAG: hypothetical protein EZS28_054078 [Streblomastix strix]